MVRSHLRMTKNQTWKWWGFLRGERESQNILNNLFGPQTALFTRLTLRMLFFMEKTTVNKNIKIISVLVGVFYSFDLIFPMFPWCFLRFSNDLFCVSFNFLSIFSVFTYFSKMFPRLLIGAPPVLPRTWCWNTIGTPCARSSTFDSSDKLRSVDIALGYVKLHKNKIVARWFEPYSSWFLLHEDFNPILACLFCSSTRDSCSSWQTWTTSSSGAGGKTSRRHPSDRSNWLR